MRDSNTAAPLRSGAKKGPRLPKTKEETAKYLAAHPGRGERPLRRVADQLGLTYETSPPILRWFPDLVFRGAKLIIEVDGGYHFKPQQIAKDRNKDQALRAAGWKVVRVWAGDAEKRPLDILWGAFTTAFGLGAEEAAMNLCRGPRKVKRTKKHNPPTTTPEPGKMRVKDLKAILREQERANLSRRKTSRARRNAAWNASASERYEAKIGGRKVVNARSVTPSVTPNG